MRRALLAEPHGYVERHAAAESHGSIGETMIAWPRSHGSRTHLSSQGDDSAASAARHPHRTATSRERLRDCKHAGSTEKPARSVEAPTRATRTIARREPHQFDQSAISRRVSPCPTRPLAPSVSGLPSTCARLPRTLISRETRSTRVNVHAGPRLCKETPSQAVVFSPCVASETRSCDSVQGRPADGRRGRSSTRISPPTGGNTAGRAKSATSLAITEPLRPTHPSGHHPREADSHKTRSRHETRIPAAPHAV